MREPVFTDHENGVVLSGKFGGGRVAYLGTDRDLRVVLEIFKDREAFLVEPEHVSVPAFG